MSEKLTIEIFSIKEKLPKTGTFEEPHSVWVWAKSGEFLGDAEYFARREPTRCNPDALKGLKGFLHYIGDEMWAECYPSHWCEIPSLEIQPLESAVAVDTIHPPVKNVAVFL